MKDKPERKETTCLWCESKIPLTNRKYCKPKKGEEISECERQSKLQ